VISLAVSSLALTDWAVALGASLTGVTVRPTWPVSVPPFPSEIV
jgi:hypothetical protein